MPQTIPGKGHRHSLSGMARCASCGTRLRVIRLPRMPGMLCGLRIDKGGCRQPVARLPLLEDQMATYLKAIKLPEDYRQRMLASCRDMESETSIEADVAAVKSRLSRIRELYVWGDVEKTEYLAQSQELRAELARLNTRQAKPDHLGQVGKFLQDISLAWAAADQEQRNRLASELFQTVWVEDGRLIAVTPMPEMVPFFDLIYTDAVKDHSQWRPRRDSNPRSRP